MSTPIPSLGNKTPEQLKVTELREELKKRGFNNKGLKKDLVERLDEVLRQEAAESAAANESKKSPSPDPVSDKEEETSAFPSDVVEAVTHPEGEGDTEVKVGDRKFGVVELEPSSEPLLEQPDGEGDAVDEGSNLKFGVVELEPSSEPLHGGNDLKTGIVEPTLSLPVPEEDGLSKGKEAETDGSQVVFGAETSPEGATRFVEPIAILTAESYSSPQFDGFPRMKPESAPPVVVMDEGNKTFVEEGKLELEGTRYENVDSDKLGEAGGIVEAESEANELPGVEMEDQTEHLKSHHRSGPASSTDAVIIEASEAEEVPTETAALSEGLRSTAYGEGDAEEESVMEETGEPMITETMTVETVSVVTETTIVTTETVVVNEIVADLSTVEGDPEGSFTQRSSDAGTLSIEGKVAEVALDEQSRDKDEGMEVEQDAKVKDAKPMEIDSDSLTGLKRKDGEELRQQEPTKRQRRWNSDKSIGASADVSAPSQVNTTDTLKEAVAPAARDISQKPVAPSPSTASSTPKASAASTSFDRPVPSRTVLPRTDIAANGDVDKKRVVPPPTRSATVSLKIDRFVRPFTIRAVRELLDQTGTVRDMWMDPIKTHCFVTYSSVEEATTTRNALYHLQWPVAGGKLLVAEFVEPEEVTSRLEANNDKAVPTPVTTPRGSANSSTQVAGAMGITPPGTHIPTSALPPPPPLPPPPRERPALPPKKEPEPPIPTLDDLFKKTRTKPQIYFLPLTDEQVAENLRNKQPVGKAPVKA